MASSSADCVLGRRAINFVGQHQVREDRPVLKAERLRAAFGIDDHAADDVSGHQVGRELDARIFQVQHARKRAQQRGLAQSGDALQQHVAAGEQADEHSVHHILLADDDLSDFVANILELGRGELKSSVGLHELILPQGRKMSIQLRRSGRRNGWSSEH
jgi:hypothetical protein